MSYYGKFYRTALDGLLRRINAYLMRWARRRVQAAELIQGSQTMAERAAGNTASHVRPLAAHRVHLRPDCRGRMTGDWHVWS